MSQRCFNTTEAVAYLGLKRRSFEIHILPRIAARGVRIGTSVVFERADLDAAWEKYKIEAGSEQPGEDGGISSWVAKKKPESTATKTAMKSTKTTSASDFAAAASLVLRRRRAG
jgi:hypothetical protein